MKSKKLLIWMLIASTAVFAIHLISKYVSVVVYQGNHVAIFELSNRFDMNDETSLPQWFTHMGFLSIAVLAGFSAYMAKHAKERRLWAAVAFIGLILSVDDVAGFHETILQLIHINLFKDAPATLTQNAWLIILPVVLVVLGWILATAARVLPKRTMISASVGAVVFLSGVILMDSIVNTLPIRSFEEQGIAAGIEGWLQLIGLSIVVYTIGDYIERRHGASIKASLKKLKTSDS